VTTLATLTADIESWTTYSDPDFIAAIPTFIRNTESRVFYFVQLPQNQRHVGRELLPATHGLWRAAHPTREIDVVPAAGIAVIGIITVDAGAELEFERFCHGTENPLTALESPVETLFSGTLYPPVTCIFAVDAALLARKGLAS